MADDGIQAYFAKFGLDASEFLDGLNKSQSGILAFYRDVSVSLSATMFIFDKLMSYGQQFIQLANQAAEFVSVLDRLSVTTGMTNEELERFSNVARYADSDISSLAAMVNKLQINLRDQGEQGEKARKVLDAMHVSYKNADGSLRSSAEIFPEVIGGLGRLSSSADRVTASNILVGRGYQELSGYIALGKDGIEKYYNTANTLTEDQRGKLRNYENACKDLDSTLQKLNYTVGSKLAPSFATWASEVEKAFGDANAPASRAMDFFLQRVNEVLFTLEATAKWVALSTDGSLTFEQKQQKCSEWVADFKDQWADLNDTVFDARADAEKRFGIGGGSSLPSDLSSDNSKKITAEQIVAKQTELARKTIEANRAEREYQELKKKTNDWQSTGVKTQLEFNENLELARLRAVSLKNECAGITAELQAAGVAAAGVASGPTYNSANKAALNTGGVGPDWAGFSDLANMTADQLQAVIDRAEKGGGSKGMAEKARTYLSMLGSSGKATISGASKATDPASIEVDQTKTITSEYQKRTDAFKKHLDDMEAYRTEKYPELEMLDLTHWATSEEIAKVAEQKIMDFMAAAVNFGGTNPIIQNMIVMSKDGPNWTPAAFTPVSAPKLESADFTQVGASVQAIVAKGMGNGTSGSGAQTVKVALTVNDQTAGGITVKTVSKGLAGVNGIGGMS